MLSNLTKIAKHNIKMFFTHPLAIIVLIAPVLIATLMLGKISMSKEIISLGTVGVYSEDQSLYAEHIIKILEKNNFKVKQYNEQIGEEAIQRDTLAGAINIETQDLLKRIEENKPCVALLYGGDSSIGQQIEGILTGELTNLRMLVQIGGTEWESILALEKKVDSYMPDVNHTLQEDTLAVTLAFGMFTMIFLMLVGFSLSPLIRERETKVYERVCLSPIRYYEYLGGHLLGTFGLLMIQVLSLAVVFKLLKVDMGISMFAFCLIGFVLAIVGIGFSMLALSFTKRTTIYSMVIGIGVTPLCMVSDCLFPIELMPRWIQNISYVSPIRWVMKGYKGMLEGETLGEVTGLLLIGMMLAVIMILISIVVQSYQKEC